MQLYERPFTSSNIFKRFKGLNKRTLNDMPDTSGWFATAAGVREHDVWQAKPQQALNLANAYVQERESLGGQPGTLYTARANVLKLTDPGQRTQGLAFLDKLQALPLSAQQQVLAFLQGGMGAADPNLAGSGYNSFQQDDTIEGLGLSGQLEMSDGQLQVTDDSSGIGLYIALKTAFPELDIEMGTSSDAADAILNDISSSARTQFEPGGQFGSEGTVRAAQALRDFAEGDLPLKTALARGIPAGASVFGDFGWNTAGQAGRELERHGVIKEGVTDSIASHWGDVEQGLSDTLVGYYDPVSGQQVDGLLNWGEQEKIRAENPNWSDDQVMEQYNATTQARGDAFSTILIVGGAVVGGVAGGAAARIKVIRSVVGETDDIVKASLPTLVKPAGGTGLLDKALAPVRAPLRAGGNLFDKYAVQLFRQSPDEFFHQAMFGKLYRGGGGQKLIKALSDVKKMFPGEGSDVLDKQVGYLRQRYGSGLPDQVIRLMLTAPDSETARFRFVQYATQPQGPQVIQAITREIDSRTKRLGTATETVTKGEHGIEWETNLKRYNELAAPDVQRARSELLDPQGRQNLFDGVDPEGRAAVIKAIQDEVEIADLRNKLGFTPHTKDRGGKDFVPSETPRVAPPSEGEELTISMNDADRLADPELWDPTTTQVGTTASVPRFNDETYADVAIGDPYSHMGEVLNDRIRYLGYDETYGYKVLTKEDFDAAAADGMWIDSQSYAETAQEAMEELMDEELEGRVVIAVKRTTLGQDQHISPEHINVVDPDHARITPIIERVSPHEAQQGMGVDALADAAMTTRQVIDQYASLGTYPHLRDNEPLSEVLADMVGMMDDDPGLQALTEHALTTREQIGENVFAIDIASPYGLENGETHIIARMYYVIDPETNNVLANLYHPLFGDGAEALRSESNLSSITMKSVAGDPSNPAERMLQAIVKEYDPDPDLLSSILRSNVLSRKGAMATHRTLKKLVKERTDKVGKLSRVDFEALKSDIAENGIQTPLEVTVNPNTGEAIMSEGFHRWLAAKELGIEEIPVKVDYDTAIKGQQFYEPPSLPQATPTQLQKLARERLGIQLLEEKLATTYDDVPMIHYPRMSHIRAIVRAPTTRAERFLKGVMRVPTLGVDPLKFVDELPSRPTLYVPDHSGNPANWLDQNATTMENVLHRIGVPTDEASQAIGRLGRIRNAQEFYEVLEKEIFGDGGLVDRHLRPDIRADSELRGKLIYLHGRSPETRTRSLNRSYIETGAGRTPVDTPILAVQKGGELSPLPSRPTEFLNEVALPNVDDIIEATSILRRTVRAAEKARVGRVSAATPYNMGRLLMHVQTATLKPLVMLVRLPAMGMRIQLEQSLRMAASGYRPVRGMPEGWTLFPGGIPIPFSKKAAGLGGAYVPENIRVLSNQFGPDGWKMLDPDPRYASRASQLPPNAEIGGFLEETTDNGGTEVHATGTQELKDDPSKITGHHLESHRKELAMASEDWLDRRLAGMGLDKTRMKEWLLKSRKGRQFMDKQMGPQLRRSTLFPNEGNLDGQIITLSPEEAASLVEFPDRLGTGDNTVGRTLDQMNDLEASLDSGYDPNHIPAGGTEPVGYIVMEYNPQTGNAIIREGHHRIGVMQSKGQDVPVQVKIVDSTPAVRGANIDEVDTDSLLSELSRLSPIGDDVGKPFDMARFAGSDEARMGSAVDAWLDGRVAYLKAITKEDPDLLDFISSGRLRTQSRGNVIVRKYDPNGRPILAQYQQVDLDVNAIRSEIARRNARGDRWSGDQAVKDELTALQLKLRERERVRADLLEEYPDELDVRHLSAGDKHAFRAELRNKWEQNPDSIPDRIMMEDGEFRRNPDVGLSEDMKKWGEAATNAMYRPFHVLTRADRRFTRGSLWEQEYSRAFQKYTAHGYDRGAAHALAHADAGTLTRDLMYDLNARTSVQRALKDLFWFAPATQEVLYTWLVKIPSRSYWPIGAASLFIKGKVGMALLKKMGVVSEDAEGTDIVVVPWMSTIVNKMSGGLVHAPEIAYGKVTGLNIVASGPIPGLSTIGNFALGRAALKWGGPFKELSDVFQPYGPEASLLPQPVTFLHEAVFGEAPPFEPLSGAYTKAQWDRSFDQGIQYGYHDLAEDGITPPRIEDFGTADENGVVVLTPDQETVYQAAAKDYLGQLMEVSSEYARGHAWVRLMGSTIMPMSIYTTTEDRQAWEKFWDDLVGEGGELSQDQRDAVSGYVEEHPNSLAFSVFTTKYGDKKRDLPFAESNDDAYFDAYYTEEAGTLTPEEFSLKLMGTESRRFYQAQADQALRAISPEMDPWELLRHAGARSAALTSLNAEWDRYRNLNPDVASLMDSQSQQWAESNNLPKRSFEAERLSQLLGLLKQVTPMLTGEDGIRPEELRSVQGQVSALLGETGEFPEPSTPTAKAMGWWYENVLNPYLDKTATLYEDASDLQSRGLDASQVYEEIRNLSNQGTPTYKGQEVPSVEEFFWGNKTAAEQDATKVTWASRPVSWLTDYQLDTVGYDVSKKGSKFLREVSSFDDWFYNELERRDVASGSQEYDDWQKFRDQRLSEAAEQYGPEAVKLLALNEAPPVTRVVESGFGSKEFQSIAQDAQWVAQSIEDKGFSPKSYSETAMEWKMWFYGQLDNMIANDPGLAKEFEKLEPSFVMDNGVPRQDVVLWEALFFGNFNENFIPQELAQLGG